MMTTSIASTRNDSRGRDAADELKVARWGARESQEAWHRTITTNTVLVDFGCRDDRDWLLFCVFLSIIPCLLDISGVAGQVADA